MLSFNVRIVKVYFNHDYNLTIFFPEIKITQKKSMEPIKIGDVRIDSLSYLLLAGAGFPKFWWCKHRASQGGSTFQIFHLILFEQSKLDLYNVQ